MLPQRDLAGRANVCSYVEGHLLNKNLVQFRRGLAYKVIDIHESQNVPECGVSIASWAF